MCKCPGDGGECLEDPVEGQGGQLQGIWERLNFQVACLRNIMISGSQMEVEMIYLNYWNHFIISQMQGPTVGSGSRKGVTHFLPLVNCWHRCYQLCIDDLSLNMLTCVKKKFKEKNDVKVKTYLRVFVCMLLLENHPQGDADWRAHGINFETPSPTRGFVLWAGLTSWSASPSVSELYFPLLF